MVGSAVFQSPYTLPLVNAGKSLKIVEPSPILIETGYTFSSAPFACRVTWPVGLPLASNWSVANTPPVYVDAVEPVILVIASEGGTMIHTPPLEGV